MRLYNYTSLRRETQLSCFLGERKISHKWYIHVYVIAGLFVDSSFFHAEGCTIAVRFIMFKIMMLKSMLEGSMKRWERQKG